MADGATIKTISDAELERRLLRSTATYGVARDAGKATLAGACRKNISRYMAEIERRAA